MKQRRYIAWLLILISMIMLVAPVLPHHHHREILCLQQDAYTCFCNMHQQHQGNADEHTHHTCTAGCVTKFNSITPHRVQSSVSPDYLFCHLLYTLTDILELSLRLPERSILLYGYYLERLHSICLPHIKGLRAPPTVFA